MAYNKHKLKTYGLGLGLRRELLDSILAFYVANPKNDLIQWLEIVPENHINKGGKHKYEFDKVRAAKIPLIPHGVNLSVGTAPQNKGDKTFDLALVEPMKKLYAEVQPPWFSDHVSCARIDDIYMNELIPVPFTHEATEIIADNIKHLQDELQLPFLIENPSYYTTILEPELKEYDFINAILEKADCGMLLDVNNIYVNAVNHSYDTEEFLTNLDLERVTQVHIAGHYSDFVCPSGRTLKILDTHGDAICQEVYDILDSLLKKTTVNAIVLERDADFPEFEVLLDELKVIRSIMNKHPEQIAQEQKSMLGEAVA